MNEEEINQFFNFIENDLGIKLFTFQKELLRAAFSRRVGMKEFYTSRAFDEKNDTENFPENPESSKL